MSPVFFHLLEVNLTLGLDFKYNFLFGFNKKVGLCTQLVHLLGLLFNLHDYLVCHFE